MRTRSKLLIAALSAIALLGIAVSTASANHLEVLWWERGFRIITPTTFSASGFGAIACTVTLEGTFHRHTYEKTAESLIGYITRAAATPAGGCSGGNLRVLTETLPWHVRYTSFGGVLPTIETLTLRWVLVSFLVETAVGRCLYQSTALKPFGSIYTLGAGSEPNLRKVTKARIDETRKIALFVTLSGLCATELSFSGETTNVTHQNETEPLGVRLI